MNFHPFYETIELGSGDFDSVTAILEKGRRWMQAPRRGYYDHWGPILRWITDKSTAFVRKDDSDVSSLREDAKAWYCNKGRYLTSEPVDTDDTLWKRLHSGTGASTATGELEVQLYLVTPATQPTKVRFDTGVHAEQSESSPVSEELWYPDSDGSDTDKDNSILTRMAALYEPAFAYAQNALQRGLQDVPLSDSGGNHEEEGNAGSVVAAGDAMVCDAIGEDDVLDTHLFMAQLRDALNGLKAGCPDSESKENASAHGVALGKVLQLLFDDPTLKVQVKLTGFGRRGGPLPRIKIEAECPTPCGIPALYVVADDRLTSVRDRNPKRKEWGMQESMIAYRDTILITGSSGQRVPPSEFSQRISPTGSIAPICATSRWMSTTDSDAHSDAAVAAKVRVIRNTARMLREMYTRVQVGAHLLPPNHTCRPHLLPRPAILMPVPAPLPVHLSLLERVTRGQNSYVFTGTLTLPVRHGTDDPESSDRELPVHVKFVPEYSVAAHRLLAAHTDSSGAPRPLAPQLYWAGEVVPGLLMIVMETLPPDARMLWWWHSNTLGRRVDRYLYDDEDFTPEPQYKPVKRAELGDLRAAVRLLHAHGFVHGDLREVNVMLRTSRLASDASLCSAPPPPIPLSCYTQLGRLPQVRTPSALQHSLNPAQRSPPAGFALGAHTLARTEFTEMPCSGTYLSSTFE
ncbi:hypothetical protein GSI_12428 [Ganoderma sinense ZZ0214-1]|uniref:Uncharacterized protein n=1 Tax=Ganoderma sinense ZZ0214-1 TaxID=1077348 RepID=A0A2G8RVH1_9APHY|nr:hypothetical protein GSI_12428 [Ganoderma sinense ZZ0214-1]